MRSPTAVAAFCILALAGCSESPEAKRERFLSRGTELLKKGDRQRALLEFRNAAQAKPTDAAEPYYQMGLIYGAEGDYQSSFAAFQRALGVNPNHAGAKFKVAQMKAASEDTKYVAEANKELKELTTAGKTDVQTLNTLALTELRLGQVEGAIQTLERALGQSPGEELSWLTLARARMAKGDVKGTEEVLQKAAIQLPKSTTVARVLAGYYADQKRLGDAEQQLRRVLAIAANDGGTMLDLSRLLAGTGRKAEAEKVLRPLSQLDSYHTVYAGFLMDENRRAEALKELEDQHSKFPADRNLRTNLVALYRQLGKKAEARGVLERAIKASATDADALLQRAEILIEDKQLDQAAIDLNTVLRTRSTVAEARYVAARLNLARGAKLVYRQELAEALRLNPMLLPIRVELAQDFVNANEGKAALQVLEAAPQNQKSTIPYLVQRNWAHWSLGDVNGMRQGIDQGLKQERTNDLLLQDAMWKLRSKDVPGAKAALEEAIKRDPADIRASRTLSSAYMAQKNHELAIRIARESAAANPKSSPAQELLGTVLLQAKDLNGARQAFDRANQADPSNTSAQLSLAQLDVLQSKVDDAVKRLESLAARGAAGPVRLWLGNLATMKGDHNRAIEEYRRATVANPSDAEAANNLAYLLAERNGDQEEALKHAQKAVEISPDDPVYCDTLGWVLYHRGLFKSAIPYLERANKPSVTTAESRFHLAMAYLKAGDRVRGEQAFHAAMKLNASVPEAEIARKVLDETRK